MDINVLDSYHHDDDVNAIAADYTDVFNAIYVVDSNVLATATAATDINVFDANDDNDDWLQTFLSSYTDDNKDQNVIQSSFLETDKYNKRRQQKNEWRRKSYARNKEHVDMLKKKNEIMALDQANLQNQMLVLQDRIAQQENELQEYKGGYKRIMNELIRGIELSQQLQVHKSVLWKTKSNAKLGNALIWGTYTKETDIGTKFIRFNGTVVKLTDDQLAERPKSCYLLKIRNGVYLDCEEQALAGNCKASMSNCIRGLVHCYDAKIKAKSNCELVVYPAASNNLWLKLTKHIHPNEEVLWSYGADFKLG